MSTPAHVLMDRLKQLGYRVEKLARGEIYRVGSTVVWFDFAHEIPGGRGQFFHGTSKKVFENLYKRYPDSFFIVFLLGFRETTEVIVVSAHRFNEMFEQKNTDRTGHWKYSIHLINGRYLLKVWGMRDFDITDGLHKYEFLGLTHEQSVSLKNTLSSASAQPVGAREKIPVIEPLEINGREAAQGVLLHLGNLLGYDTYTPDQSLLWNNRRLGELATLTKLPEFTYPHLLKFVRLIDVIWFSHGFPFCCFEVEHATNVKGGLLRQYQIAQATNARFFIVGPEDQHAKFETEVQGEPFRTISGRYSFKSYGELMEFYKQTKTYRETRDRFGV